MGLFGLSNKAVSFLGGVASGVEEVIDKDEAYTNELVKDSASMIIKARLDSKERRRQRVSEYSNEMSQLVAVGYGKQESAGIVSQGLTNDFIKLAKTTPKDKLNTLYKVTSKYDGALSVSDLSEAIAGKYKQPTIDLSGIPKRGTFLSAIGIEGDPSEKIKQRVESLSPTETDSTVNFDALAGALSGNVTPEAQELLRSESGTLTASTVQNRLQKFIVRELGGDLNFIGGEPKFNVQRVADKNFSEVLTAKYLSLWRSLTRSGNYNKEEAYEELLNRIRKDEELIKQGTLKVDDGKEKNNININKKDIIEKKDKDEDKPEIKIVPKNDVKINEIKKNFEKQYKSNNFNTLGDAGKAKFRRDLIKKLVEKGGMSRQDAIDYAKATYP